MSVSNWRSNIAVVGGVATGILIALWFSTVVALGPAPGRIGASSKAEQGEAERHSPQQTVPPSPDKPYTGEHEAYCQDAASKKDCIIALRNAEAAERQAKFALIGLGLTLAAVLLSAGGLLFIWWTLDATKSAVAETAKAANAAVESNRLNRESFTADLRPWVSVTANVARDLTYEKNQMMFTLARFDLKNSGKTPATRMTIKVDTILYGPQHPDVRAALNHFCQTEIARRRGASDEGEVLFPSEVISRNFGVSAERKDIEAQPRLADAKIVFFPLVLICIVYKSGVSEGLHHTGRAYLLLRAADNGNAAGILPDEGPVPMARLGFDIYPGVSFAD